MKTPRTQDWPELLAATLETRDRQAFRWGTHDCALFAADVIQSMTGIDAAGVFRSRYDTKEAAETELVTLCDTNDWSYNVYTCSRSCFVYRVAVTRIPIPGTGAIFLNAREHLICKIGVTYC